MFAILVYMKWRGEPGREAPEAGGGGRERGAGCERAVSLECIPGLRSGAGSDPRRPFVAETPLRSGARSDPEGMRGMRSLH